MKTALYKDEQVKKFSKYYRELSWVHDTIEAWNEKGEHTKEMDRCCMVACLTFEDDKIIALDNRTGDCWVEQFENILEAIDWIEGRCDSECNYENVANFEGDMRTMNELFNWQRRAIAEIVLDYTEMYHPYSSKEDLAETISDILYGSRDLTVEDLWGVYEDDHPHLEWVIDPDPVGEYEVTFTYTGSVYAHNREEAVKKVAKEELCSTMEDLKEFYVYVDGDAF